MNGEIKGRKQRSEREKEKLKKKLNTQGRWAAKRLKGPKNLVDGHYCSESGCCAVTSMLS